MSQAEQLFHQIAADLPEMKEGKMFGALCIKAPNGKAGVMYYRDTLIFKLPKATEEEILSLDGAHVFEPMEGRPMRGWVQLPYDYAERWPELAREAMAFVRNL